MPYAIVMLSYSFWFRRMKSTKSVMAVFLFSFIVYYIVALIYGRYWDDLQNIRPVLIACRYIEQLCPFLFGALTCFFSEKRISFNMNSILPQLTLLLLIAISFVYSTLDSIPLYPLYCGILMLLFANFQYAVVPKKVLSFLGRHSMTIWLIHTYFSDLLLQSFIYGFKYPILIFVVEMAISTTIAVVIDKLFTPVTKMFVSKLLK